MSEKITNLRGSDYAETSNYIPKETSDDIKNSDRINGQVNVIELLYAINSGINLVTNFSCLFLITYSW